MTANNQPPRRRHDHHRTGPDRRGEARAVRRLGRRRPRRHPEHRADPDRRRARPLQGDGRRRTADRGRAGRAHRDGGALRARVARRPGRGRLRRLRRRQRSATSCRPSRRWRSPTRTARRSCSAAFRSRAPVLADEPKLAEAFRTGEGVGWHEHDHRLFEGTERFFRPGYRANLVERLDPGARRAWRRSSSAGAKVADVGCGHGASTLIMAEAYPQSTFVGFDYHDGSIEAARRGGRGAPGSADRVSFEVAGAKEYSGDGLRPRLLLRLPARHGRSGRGAAPRPRDARRRRHRDAGRALRGRHAWRTTSTRSAASTTARRRCSARRARSTRRSGWRSAPRRARSGLAEVAREAGFSRVRRATETPLNLVLELRA